jgi:PspAA-like protein
LARTTKNKGKKRSSASPSKNRKKSVTRKSSAAKNRRVSKRRTTTTAATTKRNRHNSSAVKRTRSSSIKKTKSGSVAAGKRSQKPATTSNTTEHTIVRIMGQGQYKIDRATMAKVNEIDNEIVKIFDGKLLTSESGNVSDDTNTRLQKMLSEMTSLIINKGEQLSATEIVPSDFIIPPADASVEEAKELFQGEGIFPG